MMTKEMTGEQLNRRYHELCGWRFESYGNGGGCWHHPNCEGVKRGDDNHPASCHWMLPALHTNANFAITEAAKELDGMLPGHCRSSHEFCESILRSLIALKEYKIAKETYERREAGEGNERHPDS